MKLNYKSKNQGLTLIEALIWFAIFAAVVAGIFALYSSTRNANNASTVNKELSTIFSQTEQLFASDDTATLTNIVGLQLGVFPKSVKVTDATKGTISNVFGGTVTLTGQTPSGFTVAYTNVPSGEVCSNIVRAQKAVGWDTANTGTSVSYNSSYSISAVSTACGANGGAAKTLTFVRANANA
jgi:type II secretory pathway pseudopilin PulG